MSFRQWLDTNYLCWRSQPKCDREIYRFIKRQRPANLLEVGIESSERSMRLIRMATRFGDGPVHYVGIDLFDARPAEWPRVTLKETHRQLASTGASVRLVPGELAAGVTRCANQVSGVQLLSVSNRNSADQLAEIGRYLPRMLATSAVVFVSLDYRDQPAVKRYTVTEFLHLHQQPRRSRAA